MRVSILCFLFCAIPSLAAAEGFAGLGRNVDGYAEVRADVALEFPRDYAAHPDFRIEWWYVTANLNGPDGAPYGVQFTLFRQATAPPPQRDGWESQQVWLGHVAVTKNDAHYYAERTARGGVGQAGAIADPFAVWIDDWSFAAEPSSDGLEDLRLQVHADRFSYELSLKTNDAPVLQGEAGYSVKSDRGQASYYFSQPYFTVSGVVTIGQERVDVEGRAWMDREWSSQPLAADQSGWDWFSIHLDDRTKLMAFQLRQDDGSRYVSGNWIEDGVSTRLSAAEISILALSEDFVADRSIPLEWRVEVPSRGVDLKVVPIFAGAWNGTRIGYWEGPIRAEGTHDAEGYLELTGY